MAKEIPLTKGYVTIVDDDMFEYLNQWKWHYNQGYAVRTIRIGINKRKAIRMHRLVLPPPDGYIVDHVNCNGIDNRRENLRVCLQSENVRNRPTNPNRKISRFKGVHYCESKSNPFMALIRINKRSVYLGAFPTPEAAALAYNEAAIKYFGEFAKLNDIA